MTQAKNPKSGTVPFEFSLTYPFKVSKNSTITIELSLVLIQRLKRKSILTEIYPSFGSFSAYVTPSTHVT